jgi:hypothetical protein
MATQTLPSVPGTGGGGTGFSASYGDGLFGDGYDGNATIVGVTTLTRETYYSNLTIAATGTVKPAGFRLFVKGTLTIEAGGSLNDDGLSSTGTAGGAALAARNTLNAQSGAGGAGNGGGGNGNPGGAAPGNSSLNGAGLAPLGGKGGDAINTGGGGGAAGTPTQGQRWHGTAWPQQGRFTNGTAQAAFNGGSGGGGGASFAVGTTGGGGGGGAGLVWVAAKNIVNAGRISANGGNGFTGAGAAAAGGGGGGGGGSVCVGTLSASYGVVQALGGVGAAGINTGTAGSNGNAGSVQVVVLS